MVRTFVRVLDYFIANIAIPSIQLDLHASSAEVQLVIAGYGAAFTAGLITGGRLGDLYGRRKMFGLGLAIFTLASAACGLAPSAADLVGARIVQGIGAALLVPQVLGIMGILYTGAKRAQAYTVYGLGIGLAGVFGQLIGGLLISLGIAGMGWRAVFLINVPIGIAALLLVRRVRRVLPKAKRTPGARLGCADPEPASFGQLHIRSAPVCRQLPRKSHFLPTPRSGRERYGASERLTPAYTPGRFAPA